MEGTVRLPRALWSWLAGAGAGCCCRVLLGVLLSGVCALALACWCRCSVIVVCALSSWLQALLRVPLLQGGAVKVVCALYVGAGPLQGAGAGYCWQRAFCILGAWFCYRVLLFATGYCFQCAVCATKLGWWCRCTGLLRDVYGCRRWALM